VKTLIRIVFCSCVALTTVAAQKQAAKDKSAPASAYKLIALKVTGTTRYSDKEILAASDLQMGQNAADGDFKEAVQRLGNSGMFSDLAYSFSASSAGTKLDLQLADIDKSKLVPAQFENFVWFTDEGLRSLLQQRVPLFKQLLPLAGDLSDRVAEALQAILTEKQFPGRVTFLHNADKSTGLLTSIAYRVEDVSISIHSIEFPGASPAQAALLKAAAQRVIGAEYWRPTLAAVAELDLLPVYLQRGYLKAAFGQPEGRVVPTSASDSDSQGHAEIQVDAIVPVTAGKVYSTSGVTWQGNSAIATSEVAPLLHMSLGQPADAVRLFRDLENVEKLYRHRGYMMVQIKPNAQFDDEKSTVHYDVNVSEGDLYKMGELEITGLDTQATARMRAAWTLRAGEPYTADYPNKFVDDTGSLLPRGVQWSVDIHVTPDAKDKTVDVEIHFK
jgi:outer membrane protein assembly factor BamA